MDGLNIGDNVLIHYPTMNKLAMFYGYIDGVYNFRDLHGIFGVTEKYRQEQNIVFEVIEDFD